MLKSSYDGIMARHVPRSTRHGAYRLLRRPLLLCALLLVIPAQVSAVNKCIIDGRTVYQDEPCEPETIDQAYQAQNNREELYRQLDELQAKGVGMVGQKSPEPEPASAKHSDSDENNRFVPMPRAEFRAKQDRQFAQIQEKTIRSNADAAAQLTRILDDAKQACGGKFSELPEIGMSDAYFRKCTMHARFGGITQVVVSQHGTIPLRLYVFNNAARAQKVYSIDGVVTAIKP